MLRFKFNLQQNKCFQNLKTVKLYYVCNKVIIFGENKYYLCLIFLRNVGLYLEEIGRIICVFQLPVAYLVLFEYELWGRGKKLSFKFISLIKLFEKQTSKTTFADVNIATYTNMRAWCPVNLLFWESEITFTVVSLAILNKLQFYFW